MKLTVDQIKNYRVGKRVPLFSKTELVNQKWLYVNLYVTTCGMYILSINNKEVLSTFNETQVLEIWNNLKDFKPKKP